MDRRTFIKITSLAGPGLAAGGMLGGMVPAAKGSVQPMAASAGLPLPPVGVDFAIVGDFGAGNYDRNGNLKSVVNPDCLAVANGIKQYAPVRGSAYVISVGDQIYIPYKKKTETMAAEETLLGVVADYDTAIGQLFAPYIKFPADSTSMYSKQGSPVRRFFCVLGDHDWWHQPRVSANNSPYYAPDAPPTVAPSSFPPPPPMPPTTSQSQYFIDAQDGVPSAFAGYFSDQGQWSSTKNPRYYDLLQGSIHWFAMSSDPNETLLGLLSNAFNYTGVLTENGLTAGQDNFQNSVQGQWLAKAVPQATAPWKIVMFHNPPYVSSQPGPPDAGHYPAAYMQWGFENLDVDVVISGHAHAYERLYVNNCSYIVCGSGGTFEALSEFLDPPLPGSVVRVANKFGFMTGQVTATKLELLYVVVNAADEPGPQETMDRCILLKGGTLGPADNLGRITSIIITAGGGSLSSGNTSAVLLPGALLGTGTCTKIGYGTLTLSGSNGFSGTLVVNQGTVQLAGSAALASGSGLMLSGGELDARGVTQNFTTPLQVRGRAQVRLNGSTRLAFADSSKTAWPNGTVVILGTLGAESLRFGTNASGLTAMQCRQIRLGSAAGPAIALDAQGYAFNSKAK